MKQHNTLFTKVTPHTTQYATPKRVQTIPISGNLGKGLTHEQYKSMLDNISDLQDKANTQRMDYDEYVDYNEKATVRSDYNIADITELAKSLERLIWELQRKQKKQDKWNAYLKQLVLDNGGLNDLSALFDDKIAQLEQKLAELEAKLNDNSGLNDVLVQVFTTFDNYLTKIKNIERILNAIPYIITDIEAICNKADGGFLLKYKAAKLSEIDLDAELPLEEEEDDTEEEPSEEPAEEDTTDEDTADDEETEDDPMEGLGTDASKTVVTEMVLASPEDMSFANLYADYIHFPELTDALESTKDAIGTVESSASNITTIFSGELTINSGGGVTVASTFYSSDSINHATASIAGAILSLSLNTKDPVQISSVCTNPRNIAHNIKGGRSAGGLVSIHAQAQKFGSTESNTINFYQYAQSNSNNDSWGQYNWTADSGITGFYVTVFGTVSTSGVTGGSSSDIPIPDSDVLIPTCSSDRTDPGLEPRPEPEPEPEPKPIEGWKYYLTVEPTAMSFKAEGGSTPFTVTSYKVKTVNGVEQTERTDVGYTTTANDTWVTLGEGQITAAENEAEETRDTTVSITQNESSKHGVISVFQEAQTYEFYYNDYPEQDTLSTEIKGSGEKLGYLAGGKALKSRNGSGKLIGFSYKVTYDSGSTGWITPDTGSYEFVEGGTEYVEATVAENDSPNSRTATIVITQNKSNKTLNYKVNQKGSVYEFKVRRRIDPDVDASWKDHIDIDVPADLEGNYNNENISFNTKTHKNGALFNNYTVELVESGIDWFTLSGNNFVIQGNNTTETRSCTLRETQAESNLTVTVTFIQAGLTTTE